MEHIEHLIDKYGINVTMLGTITYLIYLTYQKMKPGTNSDNLINNLMLRVNAMESTNKQLTKKINDQSRLMADLRVCNKEFEMRIMILESERRQRTISLDRVSKP